MVSALEKSGWVAVAKTALPKRESLGLLRVVGDVLVLAGVWVVRVWKLRSRGWLFLEG